MVTVSLLLAKLVPDETQIRKHVDKTSIQSLAASILTRGQLQPLRVRPANAEGKHVIVFGHRRLSALQLAGKTHAECIIVEGELDDATILAEQFAENIHRSDISPIDEALAYRRYIELRQITAAQAAKELSVAPSRISRMLSLLNLTQEIQDKLHDGTIPAETGYYLSRMEPGDERNRLREQALKGKLNRDDAARAAKVKKAMDTAETAVSRISCKLPGGRSLTFSAPVVQLDTLIESYEDVLKEARKARAQGLDVTTFARVLRDRAGGAS